MVPGHLKIDNAGWHNVCVSWTDVPDCLVSVFVNGQLQMEPFRAAASAKSVTLSVFDPCIVEIHETVDGEAASPVAIPLSRQPTVWWSPRDGAALYRVYFRGADGMTRQIAAVSHDLALGHYEYKTADDLRQDLSAGQAGGTLWGFLRVEAVGSRGIESVRPLFPVRVPGVPARPIDLSVSGGAGRFTLTLEV